MPQYVHTGDGGRRVVEWRQSFPLFRQRRLFIDTRCKQLIRDLEQVSWKTDANGNPLIELDKSDPMRTHTSDALGYYIAHAFPMRPSVGYRPGILPL